MKEVGVKSELTGARSRGYQIDTLRVEPKIVKVGGPSLTLQAAASLSTEPIDLESMPPERKEKTFNLRLLLFAASLHPSPLRPMPMGVSSTSRTNSQREPPKARSTGQPTSPESPVAGPVHPRPFQFIGPFLVTRQISSRVVSSLGSAPSRQVPNASRRPFPQGGPGVVLR